ncbi:MAG: PTS sugar transporter subunit IIA [Verrucomicrobia bacterium]|nr:PTS sugar transporter subunit IIA [Verrucomicrobiota bacterium]
MERGHGEGRTVKLAELIQPGLVLLDIKETKRTAAIHEVALLLEKDPGVINFRSFYDELLARERVEATSLGNGVAFPHARTDHVKKMVLAVGRSPAGVVFENSGETIHLIFVIGTPRRMVTEYLALVGAMARLLRSEEVRRKLMSARTPEEFAAVFAEDPEEV